jgi:hypothetical protein
MSSRQGLIRLSSHEAYLKYSQINAMETQDRAKWLADCNSNESFFQGGENQWTAEELEALNNRGGYTTTMDMTRKAILSIVGMLTANKPDLRAIPQNEEDQQAAKIRTMMLKQTWKDADGLLRTREIATNAYKSNIAYAFVTPWRNRVTFRMLTYSQVVVEPSSIDPMFRDAESITIKKWLPVERVKAVYGVESINTSYPTDWSTNDFNQQQRTAQLFDNSRRYMQIFEQYRKMPVRQPDGNIRTQIVREILIGYEYLYRDVLPSSITEYPIIPLYSGISTNPLKYSELHYMKEPQRFINKMYNITIQNAQATGSPKVFVRSTDIPNEDIATFADNYSIPSSINELNPGAEAPIIVQAQPLNNAFFTLYQDATQYLFRIYSSMGLDGGAIDSSGQNSSVSLYEKREAVMDSLKVIAGIYEAFLKQLGVCVLQAWSAYVNSDEIVKCCNAINIVKQVEADLQNGLDVKNEQNLQKWMQMMQQKGVAPAEIDDYVVEAKDRSDFIDAIFDKINNINDLEYDVEVVPDSYAPSYAAGKFNIAMQLAQSGAVDPETLLELAPLDDKEKIMRRVSLTRQYQSQNAQMQEEIQKLQKELEAKDKEIQDAIKQLDVVKHETDLYKVGVDERYKVKDNVKNDKMMTIDKQRKLDYAIKELMLELKANKDQLKYITTNDVQNAITVV